MKEKKSNNIESNNKYHKSESEKFLDRKAHFLLSAGVYKELPKPVGVEYCIMGRSNVGKSSFINHVLNNNSLARVSKKPGKTNLANYFQISDDLFWVDLPGYGYAKASHSEKKRWSKLIGEYCEKRENLNGVIWLVDIRHIGMGIDIDAFNWFRRLGLKVFCVITKSDKLTQSKCADQMKKVKKYFQFNYTPVVYSIKKFSSRTVFWKAFVKWTEMYN